MSSVDDATGACRCCALQDMQRPLYMRPQDALQYNIIDEIIQPDQDKVARAEAYWIKSGACVQGQGKATVSSLYN